MRDAMRVSNRGLSSGYCCGSFCRDLKSPLTPVPRLIREPASFQYTKQLRTDTTGNPEPSDGLLILSFDTACLRLPMPLRSSRESSQCPPANCCRSWLFGNTEDPLGLSPLHSAPTRHGRIIGLSPGYAAAYGVGTFV